MDVPGHLDLCSETEAVAAGNETEIGEILAVAETIERALSACADGNSRCDVPLDTGKELLRVSLEKTLLVVVHARILVEVIVVASHDTEVFHHLVLCAEGKNAGEVVGRVHSVLVTSGVVAFGVILNVELRRELIACGDIPFARPVVDTENRGDAPAPLPYFHITVFYKLLAAVQLVSTGPYLLGSFAGFLRSGGILVGSSLKLGFYRRVGCGIRLCLVSCSLCLCRCGLCLQGTCLLIQSLHLGIEVAVEVLVVSAYIGRDVGDVPFVLVVDIVETCAAVYGQMLVDLVGDTQLESEVVLLTAHVALHTVGGSRCLLLSEELCEDRQLLVDQCGEQRNLPFEAGQTVVEGGLPAAARQSESGLKAPSVLVVGYLEGRKNRNRSFSLIELAAVCRVTAVQPERVFVGGAGKCRDTE